MRLCILEFLAKATQNQACACYLQLLILNGAGFALMLLFESRFHLEHSYAFAQCLSRN